MKGYSTEQNVSTLRQAARGEAGGRGGMHVPEVCKKLGISE